MKLLFYIPFTMVFFSFGVGFAREDSQADLAVIDRQDVKLTVEQIGAQVHPFQAVRLRLILENVSKKRIGRLQPIDDFPWMYIKGPDDSDYKIFSNYLVIRDRLVLRNFPARERLNGVVPLFLDPGEKTSVSFAFAAQWPWPSRWQLHLAKPIFPVPGGYLIKCLYPINSKKEKFFEANTIVAVHVPKGQDGIVFSMLEKDPQLAGALMQPIDPPDKRMFEKIKSIGEQYPKSSYANYAHFALARGYLAGLGYKPLHSRVGKALAGDYLEKILYDINYCGIKNNGFPKVKITGYKFSFPYYPYVIIKFWKIDNVWISNTESIGKIRLPFSDAVEWLEEIAYVLPEGQWGEYRKLIPLLKLN